MVYIGAAILAKNAPTYIAKRGRNDKQLTMLRKRRDKIDVENEKG